MEADRIGLILASEACYDPHVAARVFARMKEDEKNYNNNNDNQGDNHRRKTSPREWMSKTQATILDYRYLTNGCQMLCIGSILVMVASVNRYVRK